MNSTNEILTKNAERPVTSEAVAIAAANSSRKLRNATLLAVVLIIAGSAAGVIPRWKHRAELRAETLDLAQQTVSVVRPVPGTASAGLSLPAEIRPLLDVPIYARSSGYLKRWLVDIGAKVNQGDLLAEIDAPELRQELAHARAEQLQAEAALALARTTATRWTELLKTASVSEQEAAEKQADLELKSANLEAARANVRRLEELQSFSQVKAPFSGTITARGTDQGQLIVAGSSKELFHLEQTGTLRVYARVPQMAARAVSPGQVAELTIPELPGRSFPAKVVRTSGAMNPDSRTLLVELEVDNSQHEILAGTYAQVRFTEAKSDSTLTLPSNTLLFRAEGPQVGVVHGDGKIELRSVMLGRDFGPTVEIVKGIRATDRVVLNPPDSLVSGAVVRVANEPTKAVTEK